jgi:hypothetical protein
VCSVKLEPVQKASIGSLLQGKKAAAVINCLLQGPARDGSCSAKGILAAASPGSRSTGSARQTEGICVGRSVTRSKIKIVESPEGALFVIRLKLNPNRLSRAVLRRLVREGAVIDVCTTVAAPNIRDVTLVTRVQLTSCPNRPGPASVLQVCGREVS